jgi:hypothetical protein
MSYTLIQFLQLLQEFSSMEGDFSQPTGYEEYVDLEKVPEELKDKILDAADQLLITDTGGVNFSTVNYLRMNGFPVTPGEQDSFGWLSGCIHTRHGIIVFG